MIAQPNTTISILRGTSVDEYGDEEPSGKTVASEVPASIIERHRKVFTQESDAPRVVRYASARLPNGTVLTDTDQLRDERTGVVYSVDSFYTPANPILSMDVLVVLRLIT